MEGVGVEDAATPRHVMCPRCRASFRGGFARCPRDGVALVPAVEDPLLGAVFAGRYRIDAVIGEGAMGRVYRACHTRMSRRFAVKVLFGEHSIDPKMVARFSREAEAASRLDHPHVVSVLDFGEDEHGLLYLAMDLADGDSLRAALERDGRFASARVCALVDQLASALGHAHDCGLVHRDFKPDNIVIGRDENGAEHARVVDFGIAAFSGPSESARLTTAGLVVGTPRYMAPEQVTGDLVDARSDLFALGVILYEMLAGVSPFEGSASSVALMNLAMEPPPISVRVPGLEVDPLLEALAMRLMAKRASDRPPSGRAVRALVQLVRDDREEAARSLGVAVATPAAAAPAPSAAPPVGRRKLPFAAAVAALVLVLSAFAVADREPPAEANGETPRPIAAPATAAPPSRTVEPAAIVHAPTPAAPTPAKSSASRARTTPLRKGVAVAQPTRIETAAPPTLSERYQAVGVAIKALDRSRVRDAAAFEQRYLAIPFSDALRHPERRAEVFEQLDVLGREVARAAR